MCRINRRHPMMGQSIQTCRLRRRLSLLCDRLLNRCLTFSSTRSIRGRRRCRSSELYGIDLQGYIYATFAFELAWTILWTYMHYLWLWRNNIRVYLHLCITRLFKMPVILIVIYEMCAMIIACNDWGTI